MFNIGTLFALGGNIGGQGSGSTQAGGGSSSWFTIVLMVGVIAVFYLIFFLPESRKRKKLQNEIKEMKQGDKVITNSGIIGIVDFIGEKSIYIKTLDAKLEIVKESIAGVIKNG